MSAEPENSLMQTNAVSPSSSKRRVRYVLPQGSIIGGIYEIEKPLGHGGMGEVYLVRHMKLDIYRAVKILLPKVAAANPMFATRFMQEARLAIQIQHPNIINVMDANRDERLNIYYIVMELVDGSSIRNLLKKNGLFAEKEAMEIALYAGRALEEADKRNIVHRDIKPDNIMVTKDNKVKIADLGIAKSSVDNCLTDDSSHALIGTPSYVSPEQAQNARQVDCRADIYSLGVTLYEMLTGEKPYVGATSIDILNQVLNYPVPDIRKKNPSVSNMTAKLIMRMMDKDRDRRPSNWTEFCTEAETILGRTMTINVAQVIEKETKLAAARSGEANTVPPQGIVLDDRRPFTEVFKPKLKKTVKITVPCLFGFLLCLTLMGGFLNGGAIKRSVVLICMGQPYKDACNQYGLNPPLNMAFANETLKKAWLKKNMPKQPEPMPKPIVVSKKDGRDFTPSGTSAYDGTGCLKFAMNPSTDPTVIEYLKGKKLTFLWKDGEHEVGLPGEIKVPAACYDMQIRLPGCESLSMKVDLKGDYNQEIEIAAAPLKGTVKIDCSESGFQVRSGVTDWFTRNEISVDTLKKVDVEVRKNGFKTYKKEVCLLPEENQTLTVRLEKLPDADPEEDAEQMKRAEQDYRNRKYSSSKKVYEEFAEKKNRLANFRLGEIYENGYGEWFANKERAYRYYMAAAELGYAPAFFKIGEFYENGLGGAERNKEKARKWYEDGADLGDGRCLYRLGELYEKKMDNSECDTQEKKQKCYMLACDYYSRAAEAGVKNAGKAVERIKNKK